VSSATISRIRLAGGRHIASPSVSSADAEMLLTPRSGHGVYVDCWLHTE
jgi:hypothetical protein